MYHSATGQGECEVPPGDHLARARQSGARPEEGAAGGSGASLATDPFYAHHDKNLSFLWNGSYICIYNYMEPPMIYLIYIYNIYIYIYYNTSKEILCWPVSGAFGSAPRTPGHQTTLPPRLFRETRTTRPRRGWPRADDGPMRQAVMYADVLIWVLPHQFVARSSATRGVGRLPGGRPLRWKLSLFVGLSWATIERDPSSTHGACTFSLHLPQILA